MCGLPSNAATRRHFMRRNRLPCIVALFKLCALTAAARIPLVYCNDLERLYQHVADLTDNEMFETVDVLKERIASASAASLILSARVMLNACLGELQLRFPGRRCLSAHCNDGNCLGVPSMIGRLRES
jgi:hypothetical protein